jgi:hypothetical protein
MIDNTVGKMALMSPTREKKTEGNVSAKPAGTNPISKRIHDYQDLIESLTESEAENAKHVIAALDSLPSIVEDATRNMQKIHMDALMPLQNFQRSQRNLEKYKMSKNSGLNT